MGMASGVFDDANTATNTAKSTTHTHYSLLLHQHALQQQRCCSTHNSNTAACDASLIKRNALPIIVLGVPGSIVLRKTAKLCVKMMCTINFHVTHHSNLIFSITSCSFGKPALRRTLTSTVSPTCNLCVSNIASMCMRWVVTRFQDPTYASIALCRSTALATNLLFTATITSEYYIM